MTTTLYKVLGPTGRSIHGGDAEWALPNGKAGKWMPKIETPVCCQRGYHLVELYSLVEWLRPNATIYVAEGRGDSHTDGDGKTAYAQARLIRQVHISECDLRLFAADCAEHVLPIFLELRPDDTRPADAIEAARQFARGEIDVQARAAAQVAARDAAYAARDAAWEAAGAAAGVAARDAAGAAAAYAARDAAQAARDAAREAAGAAAAYAARDAAQAARDAARDAAWAAGVAARAAGAAERQWQSEKLATYLKEITE